jgi:membrane protein
LKKELIESGAASFCPLYKRVKLSWGGLSLYELMELYVIGIAEGALSNRAGSIAFSFFMFPFALFILNLIHIFRLKDFNRFFKICIRRGSSNTYYAIENIVNDILHNSHSGLLSTGFILSIFLMANGLNAILGV